MKVNAKTTGQWRRRQIPRPPGRHRDRGRKYFLRMARDRLILLRQQTCSNDFCTDLASSSYDQLSSPDIVVTLRTCHGAPWDPAGEGGSGFDFRHFWHSILERLWVVVLCVVAGLFLSLGYLARDPETLSKPCRPRGRFPGTDHDQRRGKQLSRMRSMFLASQEALRTIEQNLTNRSLMARVVRAEGSRR